MDEYTHFNYLLIKYLNDELTPDERDAFYDLINTGQFDDLLADEILSSLKSDAATPILDLDPAESKIILNDILARHPKVIHKQSVVRRKNLGVVIGVAATLVFAFFAWLSVKKETSILNPPLDELVQQDYLEFINYSDTIQKITLSDLSTIEIYPNTTLRYPKTFMGDERTVILKGKAFFNVSSDSLHPFIVYSGNLKTSVLGTSFLINSDGAQGLDEVEVSTGRVRIMENRTDHIATQPGVQSLVLTANQKGIYKHKARTLQKTLVRVPLPLPMDERNTGLQSDLQTFDYDQTSLSKVLRDLQSSYGVRIVLEDNDLGYCTFTGNLTDVDLFKKLKIICLTTQSTYEIVGTDIIIKGKGCKSSI